MAKKRQKVNPEEHKKMLINSAINDIEKRINAGILTTAPKHRKFKVGERVVYGAINETYIRKIFKNGLYYEVESINVKRDRDKPPSNETHVLEWHQILPYATPKLTKFRKEETYRITLLNSSIESLIHKVHYSGVEFDSEYQRGHVWKLNDKIALIDSIFNNIDIGKFVFIQRSFNDSRPKLYEVLDGKQRLTTLVEFFEDRFKYNGFYYSELSGMDKNEFTGHGITYGYLVNPDEKSIYESFIKLNTCGKPMASKHIDHVKQLLNELNNIPDKV